ncbi:MAG: 30S ribosomal protein S16 [Deltaproteobacteria bacterium]|nr:30S ribosomal protein S16 [Deltaproteobacteria bacterium]
MAVRIRLARHGAKKKPYYRIVVADKECPRDGRYLEVLGTYDPAKKDQKVSLKEERLQYWMGVGAQPSETVGQLIKVGRKTAAQSAVVSTK